jgi:hypothetical protein
MLHTFHDPLVDTARVQQTGRQRFFINGSAKQNTSVLKISLHPLPVPNGSRLTPTIPVNAPP